MVTQSNDIPDPGTTQRISQETNGEEKPAGTLAQTAQAWLDRGLPAVYLCKKKTPHRKTPSTCDAAQLKTWGDEYPEYKASPYAADFQDVNLAVELGANIVVVAVRGSAAEDFEDGHDWDSDDVRDEADVMHDEEAIWDWVSANLPETLIQSAPDCTDHYFYKHDGEPIPSTTGTLAWHMDVIGGGGSLLVVPSKVPNRKYKSDGWYTWASHADDPIAQLPKELEAKMRLHGLPAPRPAKLVVVPDAVELPKSERPKVALDWRKEYDGVRPEETWLAGPIIPKGSPVAIGAPAKAGKSMLAAAIAAHVADGRAFLGQPDGPKVPTVYLDGEMTAQVAVTRLRRLGFEPDDLENLHYFFGVDFGPLDTKYGGEEFLAMLLELKAELVILDGFQRFLQGDDNDAKTINNFDRFTGAPIRAAEISSLRTDNYGKDISKGQRGSSGKVDDVDLVWRYVRRPGGLVLARTHSRFDYVPEKVSIDFASGDLITYTLKKDGLQPLDVAAADIDRLLTKLGVPLNATNREARKALDDVGVSAGNGPLGDAVRSRRNKATVDELEAPDDDADGEPVR